MTGGLVFDYGLAALVLGVALWTISARESFAAIIGFVIYGLLLTLVWVRLGAVDVALTEAAIGSGVCGVLLLRASHYSLKGENADTPGYAQRILVGILCAVVAGGLAVLVLYPTQPAPTLAPLAAQHLASTDLGNPVTAVLLAYRALDTLLETVVLLLALVGVWSLTPDRYWGGRPGLLQTVDRGSSLTLFAQVLPPIGIVIAAYIFWIGADGPGGKFQAATILAAMWILVMMAGLKDAPQIDRRWVRISLVIGPVVFLAIGLAGFGISGAFLAYPEGLAKPFIVAIEAALLPSIAVTLAMLVVGPPERKPQS
jgi:multisubunit Na+/H+ antiporter MnhB subunit